MIKIEKVLLDKKVMNPRGVLHQDLGMGVFRWDRTMVSLFMTEKSKFVYPVYDTYYVRPRT